jgi:hypothetical protein
MTYFLFRAEQRGGHVHVQVWAGTELQRDNRARPQVGTLILDPAEWRALRSLLDEGERSRAAYADFHMMTD